MSSTSVRNAIRHFNRKAFKAAHGGLGKLDYVNRTWQDHAIEQMQFLKDNLPSSTLRICLPKGYSYPILHPTNGYSTGYIEL